MFRNLLKISFRNLFKNKVHTSVNILGLSLGISAAIVIYRIISFDTSFDTFYSNFDSIYRVVVNEYTADGDIHYLSGGPYPMRESFKEDFPEAEYFTIVDANLPNVVIEIGEGDEAVKYDEYHDNIVFVDPDYFKIFDINLLYGNSTKPFNGPLNVAISEQYAEKYFGDPSQAVGKIFRFNNNYDLTVSSVYSNPRKNSDFPFDMLVSMDLGEGNKRGWDGWMASSSGVQFFLKVKDNVSVEDFKARLKGYVNEHKDEGNPDNYEVLLQPLADLHYDTERYVLSGRSTSKEAIITLSVIGILLLLAACINFINLNTALVASRAKEIGVRKVLGSHRFMLMLQFIIETGLLTITSVILSLGIAELTLLYIDKLIGFSIPSQGFSLELIMFILILTIAVTLLASLYPAFILSGYNPIKALKSKMLVSQAGSTPVKKILIVVQQLIAQALLIIVITITQQVDYFTHKSVGIDTETLMDFGVPNSATTKQLETLRNEMMRLSNVKDVTFSNTGSVSNNSWGGNLQVTVNNESQRIGHQIKLVDEHYVPTLGLQLIAGKNIKNDTSQFLINETSLKYLGVENPNDVIGLPATYWDNMKGEIVGVVKDFNTRSLHSEIKPIIFAYQEGGTFSGTIRFNTFDRNSIKEVSEVWNAQFPELFFTCQFLDDRIEQFYSNERRQAHVFTTFGVIAILISLIGLLGLISHMTNAKTKEIGIRKVLGASVLNVVYMLGRDFLLMVIIAFAIAVPLAYTFLESWLSDFKYRIDLSPSIFILALTATLVLTILTVGYKSARAALSNPVDALSDE